MIDLSNKKVLMIIANNNFRDEELNDPKEVLEGRGVKVVVASSSLREASGMLGMRYKPDITLGDVKVEEYDVIVFIGGGGSSEYWNDKKAHDIARGAISSGKILGAICIAPVTLANAGLLNGKKVTVFPSEAGKLRSKGALCTGKDVERDGKIITASGPVAAKAFGVALIGALEEESE